MAQPNSREMASPDSYQDDFVSDNTPPPPQTLSRKAPRSHHSPLSRRSAPLFKGYVKSVADALILVQATLNGKVGRLLSKPSEMEKITLIESGSVIIFEEYEASIKRWTDSKSWSETRSVGQFLLYRETTTDRPSHIPRSPNEEMFGGHRFRDVSPLKLKALVGALPDNRKCRGAGWVAPEGLVKRTITVPIGPYQRYHVVSYYYLSDVLEGRLHAPSELTGLNYLLDELSQDLLDPKYYKKSQLKIKRDSEGHFRYAGETQIDDFERGGEGAQIDWKPEVEIENPEAKEEESDDPEGKPLRQRHVVPSPRYAPYHLDRRPPLGLGLGGIPRTPVAPRSCYPSVKLEPVSPIFREPTPASLPVARDDSTRSDASYSSMGSGYCAPFDGSFRPANPCLVDPTYSESPSTMQTPSFRGDGKSAGDASPIFSQSDYSPLIQTYPLPSHPTFQPTPYSTQTEDSPRRAPIFGNGGRTIYSARCDGYPGTLFYDDGDIKYGGGLSVGVNHSHSVMDGGHFSPSSHRAEVIPTMSSYSSLRHALVPVVVTPSSSSSSGGTSIGSFIEDIPVAHEAPVAQRADLSVGPSTSFSDIFTRPCTRRESVRPSTTNTNALGISYGYSNCASSLLNQSTMEQPVDTFNSSPTFLGVPAVPASDSAHGSGYRNGGYSQAVKQEEVTGFMSQVGVFPGWNSGSGVGYPTGQAQEGAVVRGTPYHSYGFY